MQDIVADDAAWHAALGDPNGCRIDIQVLRLQSSQAQGLPVRWPDHACNLILDGMGTLDVAGRQYPIRSGTLFWIAPGQEFRFVTHAPASCPRYRCRFGLWHAGRRPTFTQPAFILDHQAAQRNSFHTLLIDQHQRHPHWQRRFVHLLALIWSDLGGTAPVVGGGLSHQRRQQLIDYMRRHARHRPTPQDLAAEVGLSPAHFRRTFQATFGVNPRTWILHERLTQASDIIRLEPERPIADLADDLGWANPAMFSRQFRAKFGVSPNRWRQLAT